MKPILTIMYWMTHINIGATLALIGWMLTLQPQDCLTAGTMLPALVDALGT